MQSIHTLCVKDPRDPRTTKPHQLPIYATSSFEFDSVEQGMDVFKDPSTGHIYSRFNNPTVDAVAQKVADLETAGTDVSDAYGIMCSSGMSAIATVVMGVLKAGDKVLTQGNLYGGSTELLKLLSRYGIEPIFTSLTDIDLLSSLRANDPSIKMIYLETPSNPGLDCVDLAEIAAFAKKQDLITVVDNTFCTPIVQQPFKYGIDYIVHSSTKYLNGHGNSISGIIIGKGAASYKQLWKTFKLLGTNCNPWDAFLLNTGMKTLSLRMERHASNALALSEHIQQHPEVASVRYLGLPSHKDHHIACRQMSNFGGMMAFELKKAYDAGITFMNTIRIASLAPTMGDVDTLILHPASMSHLNVDRELRLAHGITDGLIRVSVGIEDINDLKADFDRALSSL